MDFTREVQHFCKAEVYKFERAAHGLSVDTNFEFKCHLEQYGHCLNFRGRTYRVANPPIPTFTQPHVASINTEDTYNTSIL